MTSTIRAQINEELFDFWLSKLINLHFVLKIWNIVTWLSNTLCNNLNNMQVHRSFILVLIVHTATLALRQLLCVLQHCVLANLCLCRGD